MCLAKNYSDLHISATGKISITILTIVVVSQPSGTSHIYTQTRILQKRVNCLGYSFPLSLAASYSSFFTFRFHRSNRVGMTGRSMNAPPYHVDCIPSVKVSLKCNMALSEYCVALSLCFTCSGAPSNPHTLATATNMKINKYTLNYELCQK